MNVRLQKEFEYFKANHKELVKKYDGQFVVIKGHEVIDAYDDQLDAVRETQKKHELGTFMVQKVSPGNKDYTQTFHSRIGFN